MTYHQGSAVSVAILLAAAVVIVAGYRLGRSHSAWRDWHEARQALRTTRRDVLSHTIQFITGAILVLATLFAVAYGLAR